MRHSASHSLPEPIPKTQLCRDVLLVLVGFNLLILQYVVIREYTVLLRGTELAITCAIASFLLGSSIGFRFSAQLSGRYFGAVSTIFFLLHLTIPFSFRAGSSWLVNVGWNVLVPPMLLGVAVVGLSSYYAVFLPMFVGTQEDSSDHQLGRYYSLEVAGALLALATIGVFAGRQMPLLLIYHAVFLTILGLTGVSRRLLPFAAIAVVVLAMVFSDLNQASLSMVYESIYNLEGGRSLYVADSPYQRVEVVEDKSQNRYLYLNGLNHYGTNWSVDFNKHLIETPVSLVNPQRVLTIGNVSPSAANGIAADVPFLQCVELDPLVVEASRRCFGRIHEARRCSVVIDDGKHFLANTDEDYELIVLDIPSPYTIQTALLQSREFFELAKQRLGPCGVLSMGISGSLASKDQVSRRIAATLLESFDDVLFVESPEEGMTFALASRELPFSREDLADMIHTQFTSSQTVLSRADADAYIGNIQGINTGNIQVVLESNIYRLFEQYFADRL